MGTIRAGVRKDLLLSVLSLAFISCGELEPRGEKGAVVGVFYGGQVQERRTVEVPSVQAPKIGFRVSFPADAHRTNDEVVRYEIVRPGPAGRRVTKSGELNVAASMKHVDHVVQLDSSSKMGHWNIRVVQGERVLADRALYLRRPR